MSVVSEKNRMAAYATDGVVVEFDFDLEIYAEGQIEVWYHATGDSYDQLTLNTDFGVTFGDGVGTITTDGYRNPLPTGSLLLIRHFDILSETNWFNNDSHSETQHQQDFDRNCMIDLQQQEEIDRSLKFARTSSTKDITVAEPAADNIISWNGDGDDLKNITLAEIATYAASLLSSYSVPTIPATGVELLKPGNVAGDNGNWLIVVDASGDLLFRAKAAGIWVTAQKLKGS